MGGGDSGENAEEDLFGESPNESLLVPEEDEGRSNDEWVYLGIQRPVAATKLRVTAFQYIVTFRGNAT